MKHVLFFILCFFSDFIFVNLFFVQIDPKSGEHEGLSFEFNLCEAVVTWEQVYKP